MSSRLPPVLSSDDLPRVELIAARLDGEVYPIDQCFSPIDEVELRSSRATALSLRFPGRLIAEQRSAAWVFGALPRAPLHHQFCVDSSARVRPATTVAVTVREVVIDQSETIECSGLLLTSPVRTVIDLARFSATFSDEEQRIVAGLMRVGRFGLEECRSALARRRNLPGKRRALDRIIESIATDYPPETLYTS